ncbi:hypothetical protein Tco_1388793, partial [Tanacetum coccineum]
MTRLLKYHRVYGFVIGEFKNPLFALRAYIQRSRTKFDTQVRLWLLASLDEDIFIWLDSFVYSKDIWDRIHLVYGLEESGMLLANLRGKLLNKIEKMIHKKDLKPDRVITMMGDTILHVALKCCTKDIEVLKSIKGIFEELQRLFDDKASNHEDASDTGAAPKQQQ